MFKNKLKLTKKLAMLAISAAVPFSILAANSHASAMFRRVSNASTTRRPVVQQPRVVEIGRSEICNLSDEQLVQTASSSRLKFVNDGRDFGADVFDFAAAHGKLKFCRCLIDNGLIKVDQNIDNAYKSTPLSILISKLAATEHIDDVVGFIKYLVNECGARLDGLHNRNEPLIGSFLNLALRNLTENADYRCDKILEILNFLISKNMNINLPLAIGKRHTIRYTMENLADCSFSHFYAIYQCILDNGGLKWA